MYLARSGGGKSQFLKRVPAEGRVLLWDKSHDHQARHYTSKAGYLAAVRDAISRNAKSFRLAYSGGTSVECYEWWCGVVWAALDGRVRTTVIVEELSEVCQSIAKASPRAAVLLNQGRKYGLLFHGTSQKPQEISKTYYDQCPIKFIGPQVGPNINRFARELGVQPSEIAALRDLEAYRWDGRQARKVAVKYKK